MRLSLVAAFALTALSVAPIAGAAGGTEDAAVARDPDYAAGLRAVERKDWQEAVRRFSRARVREPDDPDVLNQLGYSYRNLMQFDRAFEYYRRALAVDPQHRGAHEYIGETYLLVGDLAGAEKHVVALRGLCKSPCTELATLEGAVARYRQGAGRAR